MPDLYIIKLGGSVITAKKENEFKVNEEALTRIASEIKRAQGEKGFQLIVVHGAGPFGHTNVTDYDINNGVFTERHKEGYEKTVKDCNFLNSVVVEKLQTAGIGAVAFDPNKFVGQEERKIVEFPIEKIEEALESKKVPVLFGQMVPDKKLNASVMSGDAAIALLAKKFKPTKVLLGTDVAGIYTADPKKNPGAERIPLIDAKNMDEVLEKVGEAATVDVTQGMKGKLAKLKEMLKGIPAFIFNANETNSFYKVLSGKEVNGTRVML